MSSDIEKKCIKKGVRLTEQRKLVAISKKDCKLTIISFLSDISVRHITPFRCCSGEPWSIVQEKS